MSCNTNHFSCLGYEQKKNTSKHQGYRAKVSEYAGYHKRRLQRHGSIGPQTCQCLERNVCKGSTPATLHTLVCKIPIA